MERSQRQGILGGAYGGIIGGYAWVVITGIVIQSWFVLVAAILCIAAAIYGIHKGLQIYPDRHQTIMGLLILAILISNFVFLNITYESIPETVGGMPTNVNALSLEHLTLMLAFFSFMPFSMILRDLKNSSQSN